MATIKHTATAPDGTIARRSSKTRTYTHTVFAQRSFDNALRAALQGYGDTDRSNYHHYLGFINGTSRFIPVPSYLTTPEQIASHNARVEIDVARAQQELAGYDSREAYVAGKRDARVAAVLADKAAGAFDVWHNVGWCSRPDLASKLAASTENNDYWQTAVVVEAKIA